MKEIAKSLLAFKKAIEDVTIESEKKYMFKKLYPNMGSSLKRVRTELLNDIEYIYKATRNHATIDTYAKKLFLTGQREDFKLLKMVLSAFFVWAQLSGNPTNDMIHS